MKRFHVAIIVALTLLIVGCSSAQVEGDQREGSDRYHEQKAMSFNISRNKFDQEVDQIFDGGLRVFASGEITEQTVETFEKFVSDNQIRSARVYFDSRGGSLAGGVALGRYIRQSGFDTSIGREGSAGSEPSLCASSCAYAFAGGVNRYYDDTVGRLGVHQFYSKTGVSESDAQLISGEIIKFLSDMGVDGQAFYVASTARPDDIVWLSKSKAEELGFSNDGVELTTAEIKLVEMDKPYLRLEQVRAQGHSRVIMFCGGGRVGMMAGVVTDPQQSEHHASINKKSYIELDGSEMLSQAGGAIAQGSVVWLRRELDTSAVSRLRQASHLEIWTEGGDFRWGGMMDLRPVQTKIHAFLDKC